MTGKFVTLEGCEGVGKSSQLAKLKEYLQKRGIDAVFTREPGGTAISEQIRDIILNKFNTEMDAVTELLLYEAARRPLRRRGLDRNRFHRPCNCPMKYIRRCRRRWVYL